MSYIVTADGHEASLREYQPSTITLHGIAHSLAQLNRFTGHACRPYSVAEHSLLVCEIVERLYSVDIHGRLAALMHDAHESRTGDLHTPGKIEVGAAWFAFEGQQENFVRTAFALHGPAAVHKGVVKLADTIALATERAQLLPKQAWMRDWPATANVQPVSWVDLMEPGRCAMSWLDWRQAFIDKYHELDFVRNEALLPTQHRRRADDAGGGGLRGFGMVFEGGRTRHWACGADGVKRWVDSGEAVDA